MTVVISLPGDVYIGDMSVIDQWGFIPLPGKVDVAHMSVIDHWGRHGCDSLHEISLQGSHYNDIDILTIYFYVLTLT